MKIEKSEIKGYHFFYVGFFVGYFFLIYFLLYHPNGLSPFQVNIHFFSNVVGSLSKRFLAETAPYALLFYLIYYTRRKWLRVGLIGLFLLLFTLNVSGLFYYFTTRTNVQLYVLQGFQWNLFASYLGVTEIISLILLISALCSMGVFLTRNQRKKKDFGRRQVVFLLAFLLLTVSAPKIPVVYSPHVSLYKTDSLTKKQVRLAKLEATGIQTLIREIQYEYFRPDIEKEPLNAEEQAYIASLGLDTRLTTDSDFQPKKIILIATESLNSSFISHYNPELPEVTPFLDQLIETYPHIDASYPSGTFTLYGLSALLCSHTDTERPLHDGSYECLPNLLTKNGYDTEFIRGFSKYYVGENVFFNKIGYQSITAQEEFDVKYPEFKEKRPDLYEGWGFSDDYLFDEAIARLKENPDEKQFLTLLTVDTHVPGGRCYRLRRADDPENVLLFSLRCYDEALQAFFEALEAEGLFDEDLLVVLTSDHLYPAYTDLPGSHSDNSFTTKPGRLPLLFIAKKPVDLMADKASQIDVASTLLDLLDLEAPAYYMGRSLIANEETFPMGQDRQYAFIIIGDAFYSFNLWQNGPALSSQGDYLKLQSGSLEELTAEIERMRRERDGSWDTDETLLKWFRNQL